jgi:hypothetical protein
VGSKLNINKEKIQTLFNKTELKEHFYDVFSNNTFKRLSTLLSPTNSINNDKNFKSSMNQEETTMKEITEKSLHNPNVISENSKQIGYNYANLNPQTFEDTTGFSDNFLYDRSVNNLFTTKYRDFNLYQQDDSIKTTVKDDVLKGILEKTPLSDLFFSNQNIEQLQNEIIDQVYTRSDNKFKISKQNEVELLVIMRSIFLQYSKNLPYNFEQQVCELNKQVLLEAVPSIMVNIEATLGYERDAGQLHQTIPRPLNVSSAGTRTNRSVTSLFV